MEKLIIMASEHLEEMISASIKKAFDGYLSKEANSDDRIMNISEAAAFLKLKIQTVYGYTSKRLIPFKKRGKFLYFLKSELVQWVIDGNKMSVSEIQKKGAITRL